MLEHRFQTALGMAGIMVFCGFLAWIFFFGNVRLRPGIHLHVDFSRISILDTSAPVKVGAYKVGVVEKIQFRPDQQTVRVTLWVDAAHAKNIYSNSQVHLESISLIGERHINIVLPDADTEIGPPVKHGDVLRGEDASQMDKLLALLYNALITAIQTARDLSPEVEEVNKRVRILRKHDPFFQEVLLPRSRELLKKAKDFPELGKWVETFEDLPETDILNEIAELLEDLERAGDELGNTLDALKEDLALWKDPELAGRARLLQQRMETLQTEFSAISEDLLKFGSILQGPDGTLQSLLADHAIYNDLRQMARQLKNAPLRLLLKRKEKRRVR